ncbi:hypothetical protein LTR37_019403 [Vermiconidia calcicola]|uniref:Uncharacterized protein n=1 Tax=Vermiconidia calcicola TaxID=1690605 RepID=A0ACC3MEF4_9PEZI|nr:hypothetical protein LTR37_019403 [Vermiconidia calcicola]
MGILQRSKSAAAKNSARGKKEGVTATHAGASANGTELEKTVSSERPKTADGRSNSFSRPRTAAGTQTVERNPELPIPGSTIDITAGNDTFRFPTPSPRLPPKSATFQHAPSPLAGTDSPSIGVAYGSPSQQPKPKWGRAYTADQVRDTKPTRVTSRPLAPASQEPSSPVLLPQLKRKKSGWKTFGGLFGRRSVKPVAEEPFYKLRQPQSEPSSENRLHPPPAAKENLPRGLSRLHADSPSTPGHRRVTSIPRGMARLEARAEADLASFLPYAQQRRVRSPSMIQREGFSPMFRAFDQTRDSEDIFRADSEPKNDSPLSMTENKTTLGTPRTPKLNLDFPDPMFERYSVMFGKLLEEPKPSLLERRQSKQQKKKSPKLQKPTSATEVIYSDGGVHNMSSANLTKSLSINVGKKSQTMTTAPAIERSASVNRPRPIQRSRTAPLKAVSPSTEAHSKIRHVVHCRSSTSQTLAANSLPPTPMTVATVSDGESVAIVNDDFTALQRNMDEAEPSWDMITSKPAKVGMKSRPYPYVRLKSPEDLERQMVQVSVARQVSVTKARRTVQHAVASKQPLRPRVVELGKDRKSTLVVFETDD